MSFIKKVPKFYMYCIFCLGWLVLQCIKYAALQDIPKLCVFLLASGVCFFDAYSIRFNLDE